MAKIPVGLQPYTLRDQLAEDYLGTLEKVAEIGYAGIEISKSDEYTAAQLKGHLDRMGLKVIAMHTSEDQIAANADELIDYCAEAGSAYIVLSWSPCDSRNAILEAASRYNRFGEQCRKQGIQFCYHNHAHEFKQFDGEYGLDILWAETDFELVKAEIDTYWVQYGGVDPVDYLKKLKGRCPLLHLKDMEANESRFFAEIGTGSLDFKEIATVAQEIGTQWFIVEQDQCRKPPLESVTLSFENLKKLNLV